MRKNKHIDKYPNRWAVVGTCIQKATKLNATQKEAKNILIKIATNQKSEVITHGRDGKVLEMNSYVNHPRNAKG
jgi:hypothetical protein